MVIDFECFQPNSWQSVGVILYKMTPVGGSLLRKLHVSCDRGSQTTPATTAFWNRNPAAFDYNYNHGKNRDVSAAESTICAFIDLAKKEFPTFYLIGDTPEYDIGLMNGILARHGHQSMSHRNTNVYYQSICTWSTKQILAKMGVCIKRRDLIGIDSLGCDLLPHTPIMDCFRTLNEYLCILETTYHTWIR
jgi:hypothetical protein